MKEIADYLYRAQLRGEIRFLLIGGRALEAHGYLRNTKDVDFLIALTDKDAAHHLLAKIGYTCFEDGGAFSRWEHTNWVMDDVDLMLVEPSTFEKLASNAIDFHLGSTTLRVASKGDLIAMKLHAVKHNPDRAEKDFNDIVRLVKLSEGGITDNDLQVLCAKFGTDDIWQKLCTLLA